MLIENNEKQILIITSQIEAMRPISAVIATVLQQVPTLCGPVEALALAEGKSFDLLIIDMHGSNERLPIIRDFKRRFTDIPAIAMVPYGDVGMVEQVLECGADDYISQPIPLQRLKTTLRNALRMRSLLKVSGYSNVSEFTGVAKAHYAKPALIKTTGQLKTLREIEDEAIHHAIESCNGCITQAARALGVGRSTLYRKIQEKITEAA